MKIGMGAEKRSDFISFHVMSLMKVSLCHKTTFQTYHSIVFSLFNRSQVKKKKETKKKVKKENEHGNERDAP